MINLHNNTRLVKSIPTIKINNKYLGEISTNSYRDQFKPHWIITELRNKNKKVLGQEIFTLFEDTKTASGVLIEVEHEYRNKGWNFGEILRLSSIMAIIENKIREFEIYSKNTAVYFHSKYKFEPAIQQFKERDIALKDIINNCHTTEYNNFKVEAEEIQQQVQSNPEAADERNLCIKTNNLLKRYITKILTKKDEYKKHPFSYGMRMILTNDEIINNKDFFNGLFKKHHIEHHI